MGHNRAGDRVKARKRRRLRQDRLEAKKPDGAKPAAAAKK
jgi:hypothetical protein